MAYNLSRKDTTTPIYPYKCYRDILPCAINASPNLEFGLFFKHHTKVASSYQLFGPHELCTLRYAGGRIVRRITLPR
jgi:hypothetical protein